MQHPLPHLSPLSLPSRHFWQNLLACGVVKIVPTQFPHLLANMDNTFNERPVRRSWQYRQPDSTRLHLSGRLWDDSIRIDCISRKEIK